MGHIRFRKSHRGIWEISLDYNDRSLPDSTEKVALRGLRGCSMPFYGVPGLEAERSWGPKLDKCRVYFLFPLTFPSLLSRLVVTRIPKTMRTPSLLNSGLDPFSESTACSPSSFPFLPTDLLSTLPLSLYSIRVSWVIRTTFRISPPKDDRTSSEAWMATSPDPLRISPSPPSGYPI